ncbi:hypothetical protein M2421_000983 [Stenotrophomonas sp. BIGb0135]|nr:hypothetical protein [Stenotrophomonas sp. BIGb0135]
MRPIHRERRCRGPMPAVSRSWDGARGEAGGRGVFFLRAAEHGSALPVIRAAPERPLGGAAQPVVRAALVEPSRARLLLLLLVLQGPRRGPAAGGGAIGRVRPTLCERRCRGPMIAVSRSWDGARGQVGGRAVFFLRAAEHGSALPVIRAAVERLLRARPSQSCAQRLNARSAARPSRSCAQRLNARSDARRSQSPAQRLNARSGARPSRPCAQPW